MTYHRMRLWIGLLCAVCLSPVSSARAASITGTLEVYYVCNLEAGHAALVHEVISDRDGRRYRVQFKGSPPDTFRTGDRVSVSGQARKDGVFEAADSGDAFVQLEAAVSASSLGLQNTVVIMVNMNDRAIGCSRATVSNLMFGASSSVDGAYRESTYGRVGFTGVVLGPYTIAANSSPCNPTLWRSQASAAALAEGYDVSSFQRVLYVGPFGSCGWGGLGTVGGNPGWSMGLYCHEGTAWAHEFGHNFGMHHASTDLDNDGTLEDTYGDNSCVMGAPYKWRHFNAPHKVQLNWLPAEQIVDDPSSGVHRLAPLDADPASVSYPQVMTIPIADSPEKFYLSYRRAAGYDATLGGYAEKLHIHRWAYGRTRLLGYLSNGQAFTDSAQGLTIQQTSHDADSVTFLLTRAGPDPEIAPAPPTSLSYELMGQ